jgi:hypothetical protein
MRPIKYLLLAVMILCPAVYASAQEYGTEFQGFFQTYRNFSFKTGYDTDDYDIPSTSLNGGGFAFSQNLAPWFAFYTQFNFYGSASRPNLSISMFTNHYGARFQTEPRGPFVFYIKGGLGYTRYSMDYDYLGYVYGINDTKFSVGYGGGVQIWVSDHFGGVVDLSHIVSGLPQLTNYASREGWDSGLTLTAGVAVRF